MIFDENIHPCKGCEDFEPPNGCKSKGGCIGEDVQIVLADECGKIAYIDSDRFEAVLIEDSIPNEADRIVNRMKDVKAGGPIGITREMLEGKLNES